MKRTTLSIIGITLLLLTGCVVTSVYPYYTAKDLTFEPALVGVWTDPDNAGDNPATWTFEKVAAQTYKLTTYDSGETNEFDAHLFTLGNQKFLDCFTRQRASYLAPTHVLIRVTSFQPKLEMQLLDYEWLAGLVSKSPGAIRHSVAAARAGDQGDDVLVTLTADTAELQKFVRKHLNNTNAWAKPLVLKKN